MSAADRVVLSRGRYRLLAPRMGSPASEDGDGRGMHRIVDASGAIIEYVAGIEAGFLRIDRILAIERDARRSAACTIGDSASTPVEAPRVRGR